MAKWTQEEIDFLKDNYPIKGGVYCAKSLNREYKVVKSKVGKLKIKIDSEKFYNLNERVGEKFTICDGYEATIVEYRSATDLDVLLNEGTLIKNITYSNLKNRSIKNPNHLSVYDIGCIGQGEHRSTIDGKLSKAYDVWHSFLRRSYWKGYHASEKSYKDVTVCEEWLNFQNFAIWFYKNYDATYMQNWDLDKDIVCPDCKIYSPETCNFVPVEVNKFFCKPCSKSTTLPIGINMNGSGFKAEVNLGGKNILGKTFKKLEDAVLFYKTEKEKYAGILAEKWKGLINDKIYEKLINYKVEK